MFIYPGDTVVGIRFGGREIIPPGPGGKEYIIETGKGRIGRIREGPPLIGPRKKEVISEERPPLLSWEEYTRYKLAVEKKTPTPRGYGEYVSHYKHKYTPEEMSPEERLMYVKTYGVFEGEKGETFTWSELKKREPAAELRVGSSGDVEVYLDVESWHKREYKGEKDPVKKILRGASAYTIWAAFNPVYYYRLATGDVGGAREVIAEGEYSAQKKLREGDLAGFYLKDIATSPGFTYVVYPLAAGAALGGVTGAVLGRTAAAAASGGTRAIASHAFARGFIYTGQAALMGAGVIHAGGVIQKAGSPGSPYRDPGEAAVGVGTQAFMAAAGYRAGYRWGHKIGTTRYMARHPEQIRILKVRSGDIRGEYISRAESPQKLGVPRRGGTEWSRDLILKRDVIYQPAPKKLLIRPLKGHGAEYMGRPSILGGGLRVIRNPKAFSYVSESMVKSGVVKVLGYGVAQKGPGVIKISPGSAAYAPGVISTKSGLFLRGVFRSGRIFKRARVSDVVRIGQSEITPPVKYSGGLYKSSVIPESVVTGIMGPPPPVYFSIPAGGIGLGVSGGIGLARFSPSREISLPGSIRTPTPVDILDPGRISGPRDREIVFPAEDLDMGVSPVSGQYYDTSQAYKQRSAEVSVPSFVPGPYRADFMYSPLPGGFPFGPGFGPPGAEDEGLQGLLELKRRRYKVGFITEAIGI